MSTNFEDLIAEDTRANQPAAGVPGRLYHVIDEGIVERDNGASWELFAITSSESNLTAVKESNETVSASTTLQDDNDLSVAVAATTIYSFRLVYAATEVDNSNLKIAFSIPSGAIGYWLHIRHDGSANNIIGYGDANTSTHELTTTARMGIVTGILITASTAGNFKLRWAQNSSQTNPTTILAGSHLIVQRMN